MLTSHGKSMGIEGRHTPESLRSKARALISQDNLSAIIAACIRRGRHGEPEPINLELTDGGRTTITPDERHLLGLRVDVGDQEGALMMVREAIHRARTDEQARYEEFSQFQYEVPGE